MIADILAQNDPANIAKVELESSAIGSIIGRGGSTIHRIQSETGARLDIKRTGETATLHIAGSKEAVAAAQSEVDVILAEARSAPRTAARGTARTGAWGGRSRGDGRPRVQRRHRLDHRPRRRDDPADPGRDGRPAEHRSLGADGADRGRGGRRRRRQDAGRSACCQGGRAQQGGGVRPGRLGRGGGRGRRRRRRKRVVSGNGTDRTGLGFPQRGTRHVSKMRPRQRMYRRSGLPSPQVGTRGGDEQGEEATRDQGRVGTTKQQRRDRERVSQREMAFGDKGRYEKRPRKIEAAQARSIRAAKYLVVPIYPQKEPTASRSVPQPRPHGARPPARAHRN